MGWMRYQPDPVSHLSAQVPCRPGRSADKRPRAHGSERHPSSDFAALFVKAATSPVRNVAWSLRPKWKSGLPVIRSILLAYGGLVHVADLDVGRSRIERR